VGVASELDFKHPGFDLAVVGVGFFFVIIDSSKGHELKGREQFGVEGVMGLLTFSHCCMMGVVDFVSHGGILAAIGVMGGAVWD
jgi:hypothetical protein